MILLMSEAAWDRLANPKVNFGGESGGTGGSTSDGVGESFTEKDAVLVFGESKGVYGDGAVRGTGH